MNVEHGLSLELGKYQKQVNIRLKIMKDEHFVERLWNKEEGLWMKENYLSEISNHSMGWLDAANMMLEELPMLEEFYRSIRAAGFEHAVLLGMGGSSMTPLVFQNTFPALKNQDGLKLNVLDSTEPEMIHKIEKKIDLTKTLFIVSSKSGSTSEVIALYNYFFFKLSELKGKEAGENFIAITDDGSPLVEIATEKKFRKTFLNFPEIGGRYSALSYFGIVPAVLMGINVEELLKRAVAMANDCGAHLPATQNPGVILGAAIAEAVLQGHDKLTYLVPPSLSGFGLWLEQLLAESTGKKGKGILPIKGTPMQEAHTYGKDRLFFQLQLGENKNAIQLKRLKELITMGFPVISIKIADELDLGKEFFRWEVATATASSILGIDPFDQPDVQESKTHAELLLKKAEADAEDDHPNYYNMEMMDTWVNHSENSGNEIRSLMEFFLQPTRPGDYISLQAYIPEEPAINKLLEKIKQSLQKQFKVAATLEYGPRYLHSTGQFHKGGPNTGVFIQFTNTSPNDIQIPGHTYSFGTLKKAQAIGDMKALLKNKRRVILIDLGTDVLKALEAFKEAIESIEQLPLTEILENEKYVMPPFALNNDHIQIGSNQPGA